jgi:hypothetical protein
MSDLVECASHSRSWGVVSKSEDHYITVALDLRPETCVLPESLQDCVASGCRTSYRLRSDKYEALMLRLRNSGTVEPTACSRKIWLLLHRYHALFGPSGECHRLHRYHALFGPSGECHHFHAIKVTAGCCRHVAELRTCPMRNNVM